MIQMVEGGNRDVQDEQDGFVVILVTISAIINYWNVIWRERNRLLRLLSTVDVKSMLMYRHCDSSLNVLVNPQIGAQNLDLQQVEAK